MSIYHNLLPSKIVMKATSVKKPSFECMTAFQPNATNFGEANSQVGEWEIYWGGKAQGWESTEEQSRFNSHYGVACCKNGLQNEQRGKAGECKKKWLDGENKCHWVELKEINLYRECLDQCTTMFWAAA